MVEIISGEKGKGKTKHMLAFVNKDISMIEGNIVYVDKSQKHMYELDSNIRLINIGDFPINDTDEFMGFLCGMISQNNDIQEIFLDSFLTIAYIDTAEGLCAAVDKLEVISDTFSVKFIVSISRNEVDLPAELHDKIRVSL